MDVCPDYEEFFKSLNAHNIKYLVVGAHAVIFYSEPRYTKDIDIWVPSELNDPKNVWKALKDFGAPLRHLTLDDLANKKLIFQIGVPPVRIDVLVDVPGADIKRAWKNKVKTVYGKTPIYVIGLKELLAVKERVGRPQDKIDASALRTRVRKLRTWHSS